MRGRGVFGTGWRHGLAVAGICALVGMAGSALMLRSERARLLDEAGSRLADYAEVLAQRLDTGLVEWANDVGLLARFEAFSREPAEPAMARRLLEDVQTRSPTFSWIGFTGTDGRVIAATGGLLEGLDVSARPWFRPGLAGLYLGDVHAAVLLANLLPTERGGGADAYFFDAAAPVYGAGGRLIGTIAGHLTWRWAEGVRREITRLSPWQPAARLLVLGADNSVLLGPDALRGKPWAEVPPPAADATPWRAGTGEAAVLRAFARADAGGSIRPALGWVVVAERDQAEVLAPLWSFGLLLGLGTLGLATLGGILAGRSVGRLGGAMQRVLGQSQPGEALEGRLLRLRDQAWHDPLTGLLNRAGFAAWCAAQPDLGRGTAVLVIDLDGFKAINDRHGHAAGDAVLQALGDWLQRRLRAGDAAVRLGGDEFLVCLVGPPDRVGAAAADVGAGLDVLLHDGIRFGQSLLRLGCSCGVAVVPREAATLDGAIAAADAALYAVKRRRQPATWEEAFS